MVKFENPLGTIEINEEYFSELLGSIVPTCFGNWTVRCLWMLVIYGTYAITRTFRTDSLSFQNSGNRLPSAMVWDSA